MSEKSFLNLLKSAFYPNRCAGCGKVISVDMDWCAECEGDIHDIFAPVCGKCGLNAERCICSTQKVFNWDLIAAPFYYDGAVREAIQRFKFDDNPKLSVLFAKYMQPSVEMQCSVDTIDLIACVPMTEKNKRARGYNQSELIAKELSKSMSIPFYPDLIKKVRDTKTQHSLSAQQRIGNVFGAYNVSKDISIDGKTVLLCDDIKTTGATLAECSKILKFSGAEKVYCACIAITDYKENIDK